MAFDKTVFLPIDPESAFELVTQPERMRRWKTVAARIDLRVGGDYRWTITPGNSAAGKLTRVESGKELAFTWGWEGSGDLPPGASEVSITLEAVPGGTNLRLVHSGLNAEQEKGHGEGWNHYLDRLVELSTNGNVEADPWVAAPDPIDVLTSAEASLAIAQRILRGVGEDQLTNSTPCPEFTVAQLIDHQYGSLCLIAASLGVKIPTVISGNFEIRLADLAQATLESFRIRGTDGVLTLGENTLPAAFVARLLNIELAVHASDIAIATKQDLGISPILAEYILGLARETLIPEVRAEGRFGPEVEIPGDAPSLNRLLALTGRS